MSKGGCEGGTGGWIFRDWRDDICLVYGKTYARVRTAEVRRSINRPLLKSHVNGTRVYPAHAHAARIYTHRVYTYTHARSSTGLIHAKSSRELFFRLFCEREPRGFHNSLSIPAILILYFLSPFLFLRSLSGSVWCPRAFIAFALGSIDLPSLAYFRRPAFALVLIRLYTSVNVRLFVVSADYLPAKWYKSNSGRCEISKTYKRKKKGDNKNINQRRIYFFYIIPF